MDITKGLMDPRICSSIEVFKPAYAERRPISIARKRDLQELLKKGAIPLRYSESYNSLPANRKVKDVVQWVKDRPSLQDIEVVTVGTEIFSS